MTVNHHEAINKPKLYVTNSKAGSHYLSNGWSDIYFVLHDATVESSVTDAVADYEKLQRESSSNINQLEVSVNQLESWINYFAENIGSNNYNDDMDRYGF